MPNTTRYTAICCKMPYCSVKRPQNSHPKPNRGAARGPKRRGRARGVEVEVRRYGRPVDVSVSNPKTTPPSRRNVDRRNDPQTRPTSAASGLTSRGVVSVCVLPRLFAGSGGVAVHGWLTAAASLDWSVKIRRPPKHVVLFDRNFARCRGVKRTARLWFPRGLLRRRAPPSSAWTARLRQSSTRAWRCRRISRAASATLA